MTGFYDITTIIKNQLIQDAFVNTVTEGDIFEVDLKKQTIFPLSHIMVNQTTREGHALRFNITVMCMDIVDKSKEAITDVFTGNDNEQDVLNTQLAVALRLVEVLDRGSNRKTYQLDGNAVFEPFTERFENYLAGWSVTFDVMIANTMTACDAGAALVTCPNATYTITDDAGNTLYSGTITSGGSLTQEITDSTAVLKDTAGSTISTTSINAQASADITAPDSTYSNSDSSYAGNIVSGGSLSLPDSQINVNSVDQGDVVSVKTIDVNIQDSGGAVTPDSVTLVGNTLTVTVPAGGGIDPDVQAFLTATGISDATIQSALVGLVGSLKTNNLWQHIDVIYPFVGGTATTHKYNLKDPRDLDAAHRLVFNGGWTHDSNGATSNGSNAYGDTKYNAQFEQTVYNEHLSVYIRSNASNGLIGATSNPTDQILQLGGTLYSSLSGSNGNAAVAATNGLYLCSRIDTTQSDTYINGVSVFNYVFGITGLGNQNLNYYIAARNDGGSPNFYGANTFSFVSIGKGFDSTEQGTFYTIVQAFQTALSRNV